MAGRQVNDVWLNNLLPSVDSEAGLLDVDATGSSKVSVTITTQVGGSADDIKVRLQGSNDGASWFDTTSDVSVGLVGTKDISGDVKGFAWVRARFKRTVSGTNTWLITAAINTGL